MTGASQLRDIMSHNAASSSSSSPRDARALRSSVALRDALLGLIKRKPLDQITIREIAQEAGVHYATFFRHHPTKDALLDHIAADQIDQLVTLTIPVFEDGDTRAVTVALCRYVAANRILWSALLTGGAANAMRDRLLVISRQVAADRGANSHWLPLDLAVGCAVSLICETLAWWLIPANVEVSVEDVSDMLDRLLTSVSPVPANGGAEGHA